jgi:hypothetical protein
VVSSQLLSGMLTEYLRDMDVACKVEPVERREIEKFDRELAASLEGFTDELSSLFTTILQKHRKDVLEDSLDSYYVRKCLNDAPKLVQRTMQLSAIGMKTVPSTAVGFYIREATRCFVYGFWGASVAMSRAALEQGLKEKVSGSSGVSGTRFELSDLVEAAGRLRLTDGATLGLADQVRVTGNRVIHARTSSHEEAWDTLTATRAVLMAIYAGKTPDVP